MRRWAILLLILLATAWPSPAAACGACLCDAAGPFLFPLYSKLPTNGRIFVWSPGTSAEETTFRRRSDGAAIPFHTEPGPIEGGYWVIPDELLPAGIEVQIATGTLTGAYIVAAETDVSPPPTPVLSATEPPGGYCEAGRAATLTQSNSNLDDLPLLHLTLELSEGTRELLLTRTVFSVGELVLGNLEGDCLGQGELDTADTRFRVTARAYDSAGQSSPLSAPITVELSPVQIGGCPDEGFLPRCAIAGGGPLLFLLPLLRRRRR